MYILGGREMSVKNHQEALMIVTGGGNSGGGGATATAASAAFNNTRVKREKIDVEGNNVVAGEGADVKTNMETQQRAPATPISISSRVSNGFHNEDLFRDVITGKFANLVHNNSTTKHEKIRLMIEESIGYVFIFIFF